MGAALKSGRWIGFIFVFLALFLPPLAYLFSRLARSWIETCAVALPSLFVLSFPLIVGRRARGGGGAYWEKITVKAAYLSMGLLSFLLVASLLSDISGWLYGEKPPSIFAWSFSFALFALGKIGRAHV